MINFKDFLIEKVIKGKTHTGPSKHGVYKNPTQAEVEHTSTRTKIRGNLVHRKSSGIVHGNDIYMWHPEKVHEASARKSLRLHPSQGRNVTISHHDRVIHIHDVFPKEKHEAMFDVTNNPHIKKLFPNYTPVVNHS